MDSPGPPAAGGDAAFTSDLCYTEVSLSHDHQAAFPLSFPMSVHSLAAASDQAEPIHSHQATTPPGSVTFGTNSQQQNPQEPYIPKTPPEERVWTQQCQDDPAA